MGVMNAGGGGGKDGGRDFGGSFAFGGERNSDGENENRPAPNGAGQVYKNKFLAYYTYFKVPSR